MRFNCKVHVAIFGWFYWICLHYTTQMHPSFKIFSKIKVLFYTLFFYVFQTIVPHPFSFKKAWSKIALMYFNETSFLRIIKSKITERSKGWRRFFFLWWLVCYYSVLEISIKTYFYTCQMVKPRKTFKILEYRNVILAPFN